MARVSMRRTSFVRVLTPVAVGALLALGCRQAPDSTAGPESSVPQRGGTVVTGWTAEPGGVNNLILPSRQVTSEMLFRLFLHLVEEQADFQDHPPTMKPDLAQSWEWSPDHKVLTFHLREACVWSDGVPVTAEDVRWTWTASSRNKDVAWEGVDSKRWITDVEVVDPHTVRFHYSRVYAKAAPRPPTRG